MARRWQKVHLRIEELPEFVTDAKGKTDRIFSCYCYPLSAPKSLYLLYIKLEWSTVFWRCFEGHSRSPDIAPKFGPSRSKSGHNFKNLVIFGPVANDLLGGYQGSLLTAHLESMKSEISGTHYLTLHNWHGNRSICTLCYMHDLGLYRILFNLWAIYI